MNYEDEEYVRYFTRETVTWVALGWEGQAVLALMLHGKFDRSGVFDCDGHDPSHAVTLITRMPHAVTSVGLERLFETKTWVFRDGKIVWPNFVHAQTCRRSDKARQRESREIRRQSALGHDVTPGDKPSQAVTRGHTKSQPVTLSRAEQKQSRERSNAERSPAEDVFEFWKTETNHPGSKLDDKRERRIKARLKNFEPNQLKTAIRARRLDPHLMGENSGNKVYDGIDTLLRDDAQVERLLDLNERKSGRSPANDPANAAREAAIAARDEAHRRSLRERSDSTELSGVRDASALTRDLFGGSRG